MKLRPGLSTGATQSPLGRYAASRFMPHVSVDEGANLYRQFESFHVLSLRGTGRIDLTSDDYVVNGRNSARLALCGQNA